MGDIHEFTYYPKYPQATRCSDSRAMDLHEAIRALQASLSPPREAIQEEACKHTKKYKVFGFTGSTGKGLAMPWPMGTTPEHFACKTKTQIFPFLRHQFPEFL